jgi:5-methylcytosine-specific restriction endonuclease McrA
MMMYQMTKNCNICKKTKFLSDFYKRSNTASGIGPYCKPCNSKRASIWNKNNPKKACINSMKWSKANVERVKQNRDKWLEENKEYCKVAYKITREIWIDNNRDKVRAKDAKRHAAELQRTPNWLTEQHFKDIQEFYTMAKELQWLNDPSDPLEVDHVIPLQGKNVSGLHVPWNLQILPKSLNMKKGNR